LIRTGRGTSSTNVGPYEQPPSFDQLSDESAEKLLHLLL